MPTLKKLSPLDPPPDEIPRCIVQADYLLAVDFMSQDGRVHGFPYAHLLNYVCEKNPEYASRPEVPPDRFTLAFSTHNVVLLGWRLSGLLPLLQQGKLASVIAVSSRYYGLSKNEPFIAEIKVSIATAT